MHAQPNDEIVLPTRASRRGGARAARDWREGDDIPPPWGPLLLGVGLCAVGVAVLAAAGGDAAGVPLAGDVIGLAAMLGVVWWAFARARPTGLLRVRAVDILYAVVLGGLIRIVQGSIDVATTGIAMFPRPGDVWAWIAGGVGVVVAPVVQELFLRGVLLVSIWLLLAPAASGSRAGMTERGPLRSTALAAIVSVGATTAAGTALVLHPGAPASAVASAALLGLVAGALVVATGRIGGALLVHVVFGASWLLLAAAGSAWG